MKRRVKDFGWIPSLPDPRDEYVQMPLMATPIPKSYDMRDKAPPVYDQGSLGSCTANACGSLFHFTEMEQRGGPTDAPSRLYEYYNTRLIQGDTANDTGATIKDAMKALNKYGVCREVDWPYRVTKFAMKPPAACYKQASVKKIEKYQKVKHKAHDLKYQLSQNNPIAFGFTVFESFDSDELAETGYMKTPDLETESVIGGHAVALYGYDDEEEMFIVRNSWGPNWALKGYFKMPYSFVLNPDFCSDFWTLKAVP